MSVSATQKEMARIRKIWVPDKSSDGGCLLAVRAGVYEVSLGSMFIDVSRMVF